MKTSRDWEKVIRRIELLMRLKSFPVALKLLEDKEKLSEIPFLRRLKHRSTLCQLINIVRNFDWTIGATADDMLEPMCTSIVGLTDLPSFIKDGTFRSIVWTKNRVDGKKFEDSIPRIPLGKYEAIAMAPLVYNPFEPDMVLIYANPAQMMLLINALQHEKYEVMEFYVVGESSCSDAIARCYLNQKASLTIPCYGERRYGHAQDDELVMALPVGMMEQALNGLESLYRKGIRYPISYAGAELDILSAFPESYEQAPLIETLQGNDNRLLVGVTGSIASGKSTVSKKLEELGSPVIDFDVLSRIVVEPGRPGWQQIVDYFGEQVLNKDKTLNRDKLSEIVFKDMEKRKKLESFTHPYIGEEFVRMVQEYVSEDPNAIIQVVIPLLIELNLQAIFHKLVLVYIPEEEQIKRLMDREKIDHETAMDRITSQLSIEEKRGYVDFIIDNTGSVEDTEKQVEELWKKLKEIQAKRKK